MYFLVLLHALGFKYKIRPLSLVFDYNVNGSNAAVSKPWLGAKPCPQGSFFVNKVLLAGSQACSFTCFLIGCFHTVASVLSSWDRDHMAGKT